MRGLEKVVNYADVAGLCYAIGTVLQEAGLSEPRERVPAFVRVVTIEFDLILSWVLFVFTSVVHLLVLLDSSEESVVVVFVLVL
jgi:hypothetical protein